MARYIVQHRRGTTAQWDDKNMIIPMEGEIVIEIDEVNSLHKLKIGDGIHTYAELAYLQAGDEIITQVLAEAKPRVVSVTLSETWNQDVDGKYSQVISLDNITKYSRLDLQPTADMIAEFKQLGLVFVTENNGGTITVYSVGNAPLKSYTMQAAIVETECDGTETVLGIPIGIPVDQSDWEQEDDTKADYIKNKPDVESIVDKKVTAIIDSAPETLNTLNELAKALGDDPNFATTVATEIGKKVDKVDGKDLSTNDFTNEYKTKLDTIDDTISDNVVAITDAEIDNICSMTIIDSNSVLTDESTGTQYMLYVLDGDLKMMEVTE